MKHLIVNADDFGYNTGVNAGVIRAYEAGVLPSTTLMATGDAFDHAVALAHDHPRLGVGVHVCLLDTLPVSDPADIPSLVGADGRLHPGFGILAKACFTRKIRTEDLEREVSAQVEKVLDVGIHPTHLDAHKHTFALGEVHGALVRVAARYGIRALRHPGDSDPFMPSLAPPGRRGVFVRQWLAGRLAAVVASRSRDRARRAGLGVPRRFFGIAFTGLWTSDYLFQVLKRVPEGVSELMVHPGVLDTDLRNSRSRLKESREVELELLLRVLPATLRRHQVELAGFEIFNTEGFRP